MTDESDDVFAKLDYETAKRIAKDGSFPERQRLATRRTTAPELLFFLATDTSPSVRQAVAINPVTPPAAHRMLARDAEDLVRQASPKAWRGYGRTLRSMPEPKCAIRPFRRSNCLRSIMR